MLLHGIRHRLVAGRQVNRDAVAAVGQLDLQPLAEAVMCCRDEQDAHVASSPLPDDYGKRPRNRTSSPTPRLFSLPRMSLFTPGGSYVCVRRRQARTGAAGLLARERRHHPQPTSHLVPTRPCSGLHSGV